MKDLEFQIQKTWEMLAGFGCGYFQSWEIDPEDKDIIIITSELHADYGKWKIHRKFFEMEITDEDKHDAFVYRKSDGWRIIEEYKKWSKKYYEEKEAGSQKLLNLNDK